MYLRTRLQESICRLVQSNRALTYYHHLETLRKKLSMRVLFLRRLSGLVWGAGAKRLCTAALFLIYSTAEYCTQFGVAARILASLAAFLMSLCTLSLNAHVPLQWTTFQFSQASSQLSFAAKDRHIPWLIAVLWTLATHILHGQLTESHTASKKRLKYRHPFVPAARRLLRNLSELGARAAQQTNLTWGT